MNALPATLAAILLPAFALAESSQTQPVRPNNLNPILGSAAAAQHPRLRSVLDAAASDLDGLFPSVGVRAPSSPPWVEMRLDYGIFVGRSAFRDLPDDSDLPLDPSDFGISGSSAPAAAALRRASSLLLLLRGMGDAAHESVLGVGPDDIDSAEYAATHPGETSWSDDHPLTTSSDLIHAAIHLLEGANDGEGGHQGYENAKFWAAGGPKMLNEPADHPVRRALADRAKNKAPGCVRRWGVVAPEGGAEHDIIAGGGKE